MDYRGCFHSPAIRSCCLRVGLRLWLLHRVYDRKLIVLYHYLQSSSYSKEVLSWTILPGFAYHPKVQQEQILCALQNSPNLWYLYELMDSRLDYPRNSPPGFL